MSDNDTNNSNGTQRERNKATRMFATEFNESNTEFKMPADIESDGDRAPNYYLTPTGAGVHRVLMMGTLMEVAKVNDSPTTYRAKIRDATGVFYVYAGQYDPETVSVLEELAPDGDREELTASEVEHVMVMGKPNSYTTDRGQTYVSVEPEFLLVSDAGTRERWTAEATKFTLERVQAYENDTAPFDSEADQQYEFDVSIIRDDVEPIAEDHISADEEPDAAPAPV
ncbi:hypothetical protein [Halorubrum sp. AJ67]|uniref:hypothetical protein n=1 Tax=Halorubrum sp. AJ67 TaxID=1173487 RepID=UPI0003DC94EE|nr:hypothetical protein [Halorubrum sp. AJ67]CDK38089.1 replication factor A [Halorubrum sp. AJ67]